MNRMIWTAAATLALLGAGQAVAMQAEVMPAAGASPSSGATAAADKAPDGTTAGERANTARLNAEQAARARAENVAYEQQVQAVAQEEAAAKQAFAAETAAYEAEKARLAAMSAEERMRYEADVAACKAGDTSRCAKPPASKSPKP